MMGTSQKRPRGFTIVELLAVIAIIGIVAAIALPAFDTARKAAKNMSTKTTINSLSQASTQFYTDNGRFPGYFSPRAMGDAGTNELQDVHTMSSVLMDLAGGMLNPRGGTPTAEAIKINLGDEVPANWNVTLIGTKTEESPNVYFVPDKGALRTASQIGLVGNASISGADGDPGLPHLVDSNLMPIIAWAEDDTARPDAEFAGENRGDNAKFYQQQNLAILAQDDLGSQGINQQQFSALSEDNEDNRDEIAAMEILLGNPNYPLEVGGEIRPSAGRSGLVFHGAGSDGVFMSVNQGESLTPFTFQRAVELKKDPMSEYDDIVVPAGS